MASSDAETSFRSEYQVFLSFEGPDNYTRFIDVLYHSLIDAGICVFRDDEEHRVGKKIDASLQRAIDNSRIYIPIFSRTYASSQWHLCELAQIMANTSRSEGNKEILPIFFDVEPDDVKLKTPLYENAIRILECDKKLSIEQVDMWREALMEVDAAKGWEAKKYKGYGELIKLVVEKVVEKLKTKHRLVTEYLVGIDDRVEAVTELLDVNSSNARLIQIHGIGGIGKTTLAKIVFNQLSTHFGKYCCFLEDVRAKSSRIGGLIDLQKKLLSEISHPRGTMSFDEIDFGMKRIGEVLCNKKVFLVLDDVDEREQVETLVGKMDLNSGSRILITTRNRDVLRLQRLKCQILGYEMEVMSTDHALELFNKHVFNRDFPLDTYNHLAREIVSSTGRLPLAIEVIGSFLNEKQQEQWIETLDKLRKGPHLDIFGKLKISYDTLNFEQKQIFLDVACFFIGEDKTNAIYMWTECGFLMDNNVDVLAQMSLLKIVDNNKFWMHDQLRDLGREIVRRENPTFPGKRSRIWIGEEVLYAIKTEEMGRNVQALYLDLHESHLVIGSKDIERFEHIRYLKLNWGTFVGDLTNCLTKLKWFCWSCPLPASKPTNMHLKGVVILEFSDNDFIDDSTLQSIIKMARKLKVISLTSCNKIIRTPNFSGCPNLERLSFDFCPKLRKIEGSIGKLNHLIYLRITFCDGLEDLPEEIGDLMNLQYFFVHHCKVKKLPNSIWKLKSLREVHFFSNFDGLDSENSWELPNAIGMLQNLEVLLVNSHSLKGQLPCEIGSLHFLRILDLSKTSISEVPKTIRMLPCLKRLELMECDKIQELPRLPSSLTHLLVSSASLQVLPDLSNLANLVDLVLSDWGGGGDKLCIGELRWIGSSTKQAKLSLRLYNVPTHAELASLPLLNQLGLFGFDPQTIPHLPLSLKELGLDNFNSIVSLSPNLRNLSCLDLSISPIKEFQLDGFRLPNIRQLLLIKCVSLKRFKISSVRKLKDVNVVDCPKLVEIQFSGFESLEVFYIQQCESFERLVYVGEAGCSNDESVNKLISCEGRLIFLLRALNKLRSFFVSGCPKIFEIQIVGMSESWEYFSLVDCPHVRSFTGLSNLKNLKRLRIEGNERLQFVKGLDELEYLVESQVYRCGLSERVIESSTKLSNHSQIHISGYQKDFRGLLESYKHHKTEEDVIDR